MLGGLAVELARLRASQNPSYDDPQSIAIKPCYVQEKHLGGMMFLDPGSDRNDELPDSTARRDCVQHTTFPPLPQKIFAPP